MEPSMNTDHIPAEAVKAYLLGLLTMGQAAAIEERYFTDPIFFRRVQAVERELIGDYLDGRLGRKEKRSFKSRYLVVPELKRVTEEVSQGRPVKVGSPWASWQTAAAGALIAGLGLGSWIYLHQPQAGPQIAEERRPVERLPSLVVRLTPGVTKGPTAKTVQFTLPEKPVSVRFLAELPGRTAPVECSAKLSIVGETGMTEVWKSGVLQSIPGNGGQDLPVVVNSSLLRRGDFVLEAVARDGRGGETFLFRVNAAP